MGFFGGGLGLFASEDACCFWDAGRHWTSGGTHYVTTKFVLRVAAGGPAKGREHLQRRNAPPHCRLSVIAANAKAWLHVRPFHGKSMR